MTPAQIGAHRKALNLSKRDFERALGYDREGKTTDALESGFDAKGQPFKITGAAAKALEYLLALHKTYELLGQCDLLQSPGLEAEQVVMKSLPEALR